MIARCTYTKHKTQSGAQSNNITLEGSKILVGVIWFVFHVLQLLPLDLYSKTCVALANM